RGARRFSVTALSQGKSSFPLGPASSKTRLICGLLEESAATDSMACCGEEQESKARFWSCRILAMVSASAGFPEIKRIWPTAEDGRAEFSTAIDEDPAVIPPRRIRLNEHVKCSAFNVKMPDKGFEAMTAVWSPQGNEMHTGGN